MTISTQDFETIPANPDKQDQSCPWQSFDRIYCISLASRPDRCENARAQFQSVGLTDRVEFTIVDKHPTDSEQGIYESHMACLRAGLAAGAKKILVFEDDVVFPRFSRQRLREAVRFMDSDKDWKLFFLGCFVNNSRKTDFKSVVKVDYRCTAHAYVIHRDFAEELVEIPWRNKSYDDLLRSITANHTYAVYPSLAFQGSASTDNDKLRNVDRARRLIGGFQRLQKWNEFSTRRFVPLVIAHVAVFFILMLLILLRFWLHK